MKVSTKGYGGKEVKETVHIQTNDKQRPGLSVTVMGFVEKFADITPPRAMMTGAVGTPVKAQIKIIPRDQLPFKIINTRARYGKSMKFHLEEVKETEKVSYLLNIENIKEDKGRYNDMIYLQTDNPKVPEIQIHVMGNIL